MSPSWPTCSVSGCHRSSQSLAPTVIPLRVPPLPERDGEGYVLEVEVYLCALHEAPGEIAIAFADLDPAVWLCERAAEVATPLLEAAR